WAKAVDERPLQGSEDGTVDLSNASRCREDGAAPAELALQRAEVSREALVKDALDKLADEAGEDDDPTVKGPSPARQPRIPWQFLQRSDGGFDGHGKLG